MVIVISRDENGTGVSDWFIRQYGGHFIQSQTRFTCGEVSLKLDIQQMFTLDPINQSVLLNYVWNFYILNKNNLYFLSIASISHDPVTSKMCPIVSLHWTSKTRLFSSNF